MAKERPILFSSPMVRAILEGRKTQTRRIVKNATGAFWHHPGYRVVMRDGYTFWETHGGKPNEYGPAISCPYGNPGDRLWVRETWCHYDLWRPGPNGYGRICYKASGDAPVASFSNVRPDRWRPSIHMPRWASRITLEVVGVRVERLQDISEEDAKAEGAGIAVYMDGGDAGFAAGFRALWESINGPGSWDANPFVWVIEFRKL